MSIYYEKRCSPGLYNLVLFRLSEIQKGRRIIPFREVFRRLGTLFHLRKSEIWEVLFILRDFGFIEVAKGHGIKMKHISIDSFHIGIGSLTS